MAYFERLGPGSFHPTENTSGAWDLSMQHIGPALGLLAHSVESDVADDDEPEVPAGRERRRDDEPEKQPAVEESAGPSPAAEQAEDAPAEPEQDALVEAPEPPAPRSRKKKGRASIPSWDEIMFGGPRPGDSSRG